MMTREHTTACLVVLLACALALGACQAPREEATAETSPPATETSPAPAAAAQPAPAPADWCKGHGLPESKCTKCNPELTQGFKAAGDWCDEHGYPESACPTCNPQAPPGSTAKFASQTIRFKADDHEAFVGIETVPARRAEVADTVEVTGRIAYNAERVADVRSLVPGLVSEVRVELGAQVARDDVLFVLKSAEVGREQGDARGARQRVATARAHRDRQRELFEAGVVSARQLELAEQELGQAQAELGGMRQGLDAAGASGSGSVTLRAPAGGVVVERPAVLGTLATSETSLATLVDTSVMWALLDAPEDVAALVRIGQPVAVRVDGVTGKRREGTVSWIAPAVDPRTRTVSVRVELDNADGKLRAHQFARARIEVGAPEGAVIVPREAIQRLGEESIAFVRTAQGVYEPRSVVPGRPSGDGVAVTGELREGDAVVTTGAFILKTELSPEAIGAGCCEHE